MPMQKPNTCRDCPLYGDGMGWVGDKINPNAQVLVISMFPTQYEATKGEAQIGAAVEEYQKDYQRYAGNIEMSFACLVRCRGQRGTKLPKGAKLAAGVRFCRQYDNIPSTTRLIVYQGEDVAQQLRPDLAEPLKWRGFEIPKNREKETKVDTD